MRMPIRSKVHLFIIAGAILTSSLAAGAQSGKVPRIGVLLYAAEPKPGQTSQVLEAFRRGLRDLGYVEGRNIILEYRWAGGRAAALVRLDMALIMSAGTPATQVAKAATTTIPIVMTAVGDPIGSGIVTSLARPDGNVTGLSLLDTDLDGKRIELLKEAVPGLTRIAMLWSPNDPGMSLGFGRVEVASRTLRLVLLSLAVRDPAEVPGTLQAAETGRAQALIVTAPRSTIRHQTEILNVATKLRLPAMYTDRRFVDAGGLMAYGPSLVDVYRRAAMYADRSLKGAKPADLPVAPPTKFEFGINPRTAETLGLAIPPALIARADQVIE